MSSRPADRVAIINGGGIGIGGSTDLMFARDGANAVIVTPASDFRGGVFNVDNGPRGVIHPMNRTRAPLLVDGGYTTRQPHRLRGHPHVQRHLSKVREPQPLVDRVPRR